jgi:RHS repeat-associated protein
MIKPNKINSQNFFPYHKSLLLYRKRLICRRRSTLPGKSAKFTSKELDPETGFYYYGARYLDPRTSRWLSGDPALGDYLPSAPVDEEAKKQNQNLPGQGGVFNLVNLHVYHYAGNNPIKYVDPDGRRTYFINGINNKEAEGAPSYAKKIANELTERGVKDVRTIGVFNNQSGIEASLNVVKEMFNSDVYSNGIADIITQDLIDTPLSEGEQLNIIGYSGGGQLAFNATEKLESVTQIDNLVLIGAPTAEINGKSIKSIKNVVAGFDPLISISTGNNSKNIFAGWFGHTGYFTDKNIGKVADIIAGEIQ